MPKYSKTVYVEIVADDEDDALEGLSDLLLPLMNDPDNNVTYVDLEGPMEEVDSLEDVADLPDACDLDVNDLKCPECDSYSGQLIYQGNGEFLHTLCGRVGSRALFTPGTPENSRVYDG